MEAEYETYCLYDGLQQSMKDLQRDATCQTSRL